MQKQLSVVVYNPLSLARAERIEQIVKEIHADIIILTGTGVRAIKGLTHHKHPVGNSHWAVHFGWEKG